MIMGLEADLSVAQYALRVQEVFQGDASLIEDGAEGPFGQVSGVVGNGRVAVCLGVEPDFMTSGSLAVKTKTEHLYRSRAQRSLLRALCAPEPADDLGVTKPSQPAHSGTYNNHEIATLIASGEGGCSVPVATGFDEFAGHVPCNLEGLSDSSTLGDQPRQFFGSRQIHAFRQQFDMHLQGQFHLKSSVAFIKDAVSDLNDPAETTC